MLDPKFKEELQEIDKLLKDQLTTLVILDKQLI